ncbi:MAG TPA: ABC transporter ATP-binding protein, partial [Erysipelotrichaceae bacterium]|nr:ABC transporter ATP-binding protein [Erysipelotrichaceae bacterium]
KDIMDIDEVQLRRQIGYVIQQIGLMPHMTIYENIVTVPTLLGWPKEKMRETAVDLMKRIDLSEDLLEAYPAELSGGMQQRIGVIRALAADQEIILMDEPFGALDPITREALQQLIKRLQFEMNKTIVFVTHDMDEALLLADKIVIMDKGKVIQIGTPKEILTKPANEFVESLIGEDRLSQSTFEYETVEKIMLKDPIRINENEKARDIARLMNKTKVDDILVVDDNNVLKGRVDLRTLTRNRDANALAKDIMKKVTFVLNTTSIRDSIYYVSDLGYRNLSVVDDKGRLVGLVTRASIVSEVYDVFWKEYEPVGDFEVENEVALATDEKVQSAVDLLLQNEEGYDAK